MFNWTDFVDVDLKNVDKQDAHGLTQLYNAVCDGDAENIKVLIRANANPNIPNFQGWTPVYMAAKGFNSNADEIIRLLSEAGANVNTPEPKAGLTPLHLAAKCGHATVIKALVDASASVDTLDKTDRTPLWFAVKAGHVDVVSVLLQAKASVKRRPDETVSSDTVLQKAREEDTAEHREIVRLLETHLLQTAEQGNVEAQLICGYEYYGKHDEKNYVEARKWFSRAAEQRNLQGKYMVATMTLEGKGGSKSSQESHRLLRESAAEGHEDAIYLLKRIGAQQKDKQLNAMQQKLQSLELQKNDNQSATRLKNYPNGIKPKSDKKEIAEIMLLAEEYGLSPIYVAAVRGDAASIEDLAKNYDVNIADSETGFTPMHAAASSGNLAVVKVLVKLKANLDILANGKRTCVFVAAAAGHAAVIAELAAAKANINIPNAEGYTPVAVAAMYKHWNALNALAIAKADVNAVDNLGCTPILSAVIAREVEVVKALVALRANVNIPDPRGSTPVCTAVRNGDAAVLAILLEAGADASVPTKEVVLSIARKENTPGHQKIVRLLQEHFKKYPHGIKLESDKKKIEKKIKQEKKPKLEQGEEPETRPEESISQESPLEKKLPPKTLFWNAIQTKIAELIKAHSTIDQTKNQTRKLQETIVQQIKTSADRLVQPLEGLPANKARLLGLEANLRDLKELEKHVAFIQAQEKKINGFLELLKGLQGKLTDTEDLRLPESLTAIDGKEIKEKFEDIFRGGRFLALRKALTENDNINDEVFESGLIVLEEAWVLFVAADKMVSTCIDKMNKLIVTLGERVKKHLAFKACVPESGKKDAVESEAFLALGKVPAIKEIFQQIVLQLKTVPLSATEEKTAEDGCAAQSQKTSTSQIRRNGPGELVRRVTLPGQPLSVERGREEENVLLAPKKLSKAARTAVYEARQAAKAARIADYKQKQAARRAEILQKEQASARARKLTAILAGAEIFPECETKTVQEETTTVERKNPLFKGKTIESYNELQKLKSIIKIITEAERWTPERKYAILQSFAFLNEVVSIQHEHPATKKVARCLRNAIFKRYKEVVNIVQSLENLLNMVKAWVNFLETPAETRFFVNERAVLDKVSSDSLSSVYVVGERLPKEVDVDKSCIAFEEMMRFGHYQCYETACSIRLILGRIRKFQNSIKAGHEIIVTPDEETFIVYYKNKNNCEIASFHCNEDQRALFLNLMFNGEPLVRNPNTEEIYKQIYAAVASREGCTRFGDDIIGYEAARFYWAITGSERGALEQAAKDEHARASALLKQFGPQVFRPEHLERGKRARHFKVLEEETKSINESADTECLSDVANGYSENVSERPLHPSLSPVVPAVTFVFPACMGDSRVNSQFSSQNSGIEQNSGQQVKSESPKREGP